MDALQLLTWSLILYLFASLASLFLLGLDTRFPAQQRMLGQHVFFAVFE